MNEAVGSVSIERPLDSSCLACGSGGGEVWAIATDIEYHTTESRFTYFRCRACDCLWIDPIPVDALNEIYPPNYYSYAENSVSLVGRIKSVFDRRLFRSLLSNVTGDALRVLDIGGGSGASLDLVRETDGRVTETVVVDLDDGARDLAQLQGHMFFHGRIEDYDDSAPFDLILMLNLIEHVANPAEVLRKVAMLLRPGGRILVKTPNWRSLDHFLFRHQSWGGFHCPRHWVLWTMPGFRALAESCGLEIVSEKYTQGAPFWAVSVLNSLRKIGLVSVTRERPACDHPLFGPLCGLFAMVDCVRMPFAHPSQMFFVLTRSQ